MKDKTSQTIIEIGYSKINNIKLARPKIIKIVRKSIPIARTIRFVIKTEKYIFKLKDFGYTSPIFFQGSKKFLNSSFIEK